MAIVQISKIVHRTGSADEIPQLDIGEIGFASDEQRVFIGNDPSWVPQEGNNPTNTEILTNSPNCSIAFSQIQGSANVVSANTFTVSATFTMHANSGGVFFTEISSGNVYNVTMTQV